jgi:serine phosphatase RsbU (regulator of sigma subunit)
MRFGTKLTLSLTLITAGATVASTLFLLNALHEQTLRAHLEAEQFSVRASAARVRDLLSQVRTLDPEKLKTTSISDIAILVPKTCGMELTPEVIPSTRHEPSLKTLGYDSEVWLKLLKDLALCPPQSSPQNQPPAESAAALAAPVTAPGSTPGTATPGTATPITTAPAPAGLTDEPKFLTGIPLLPFPSLAIFAQDRLAVLAPPELQSRSSSVLLLTDSEGNPLWTSDTPEFMKRALEDAGVRTEDLRTWSQQLSQNQNPLAFEQGVTGLIAAARIDLDGKKLGFFSVSYRPTTLYPVKLQILRVIPLILGLLLLCWLAGRILGQALAKPLATLVDKSEKIAAGQFDSPFESATQDEFGVVQQAFNAMMSKIRALLKAAHDNAILENELKLANEVQKLLLPPKDLRLSRFQIASHFETATYCGGDLWGYIEVPHPTQPGASPLLLLFIGDVEGHGAAPALVTAGVRGAIAMLSSWLKQQPELSLQPAKVNEYLNDAVFACTKGSMLMTFCTIVLDSDRNRLIYSNAGHCRPYVLKRDPKTGKFSLNMIRAEGSPFGNIQGEQYGEWVEEEFGPDAILVIYSDGLVEAKGPGSTAFKRKDLRRLLDQLPKDGARRFLDEMISKRRTQLANAPIPEDDVTVVVCRLPSDGTRKAQVPPA